MLVLSRRHDESVVLTLPDGRRITVTVTAPPLGGVVRLGFDAPADIAIHRAEVQVEVDARHPDGLRPLE